jgi:hypothetical protein
MAQKKTKPNLDKALFEGFQNDETEPVIQKVVPVKEKRRKKPKVEFDENVYFRVEHDLKVDIDVYVARHRILMRDFFREAAREKLEREKKSQS